MIDAAKLRAAIKGASNPMRAMILLGINCGFGQTDIANLPRSAIDLKRKWIDYPRIKTAVPRRCPLWPETVKALCSAIACRGEPRDKADDGLVFLTRFGHKWVRTRFVAEGKPATPIDSVQFEFQKVLMAAKVERVGFYTLRHVF
jgi:integrase